MNAIPYLWIICIACIGLCMTGASAADVSADAFLTFEEFPVDTYIAEQYASDHIHFMSDSAGGGTYRAAPRIVQHGTAKSPTSVLVNGYSDWELSSSENASLVIWFDKPVSGVGMWLGTVPDTGGSGGACPGPINAKVSAYSCSGILRNETEVLVTPGFDTPLEIDDNDGFSMLVIDYGSSLCPEAIDDLAFNYATGPGSVCSEPAGISIWIRSPASSGERITVNEQSQTIQGIVGTSGIFKSVQIDGEPAQAYLNSSFSDNLYPFWFEFTGKVTLEEGGNTITAVAENLYGYSADDQIYLDLGTPDSATLDAFHLTQRGVMQDTSCDIDTPLVAGKSAIIRIDLDVKTKAGYNTYVSWVEMNVSRKGITGSDITVGTLNGWVYSPFVSGFGSPTDMASIHFWVPGEMLHPAGDYKFTFQPYAGMTPIGSPLTATCNGEDYYTFEETRDIEAIVLPVEAGLYSPRFMGTNHTEYTLRQIYALTRTYPIQDSGSGGFYFYEVNPFSLCDGTMDTVNSTPDYCGGTGFEWTFIDHDASGILTRADAAAVTNASIDACGNPDDHQIGGAVQSGATFTYAFDTALGIYRAGAHPKWKNAKFAIPLDSDHDGTIDTADLSHYIAEFYDDQTDAWTTDLNLYDQGETFRFFIDADGDYCNDESDETQADIRLLWNHQQSILWGPVADARAAFCKDGNCGSKFPLATFWFPDELVAHDSRFGDIGPGQGKCGNGDGGLYSWIKMRNASALPHEFGHNIGGLSELYTSTAGTCKRADPDADDMDTKEGAWAVYIDTESVAPGDVYAVMGLDAPPDRVVHYQPDYQDLFDTLRISSSSAVKTAVTRTDGERFVLTGLINSVTNDHDFHTDLMTGVPLTEEDAASPYSLVFGNGTDILQRSPFPVDDGLSMVEGYPNYTSALIPVQVVAPFPADTGWVEVRYFETVLERFVRSAGPPTVTLTAPSAGDTFGGTDVAMIRWTSSDPDGDALTHTIHYSPDGGDTWRVVATRVGGTEFAWDLATAPATKGKGVVRIVASDGLNAAEDGNAVGFSIANKPPIAIIVEPHDGRTVLECSRVMLRGYAYDPDGDSLTSAWYVDGLPAGTGTRTDVTPLAPGVHIVRLEVSDTEGFTAIREAAFTVLSDSDCDGMADDYEDTYGLHPGYTADAAGDNDGDGLINFDEARYGTNPRNADTDGDGVSDGDEVAAGTDPLGDTGAPPVADAGGPYGANEGTPVMLDASGSSDPDGDVLSYRWDLNGDGAWDTAWSADPTFSYLWCDDYTGTVSVQVVDTKGLTSTASASVQVVNVPPTAGIGLYQPNRQFILPLLQTTGNAIVTDPGCDSWTYAWDLNGNGTIDAFTRNVTYVYPAPGVYTVELTVTDDDGGTGITTVQLTVSTVAEAMMDLSDYIMGLPDGAFKGNADQRKNALHNMFEALDEMIAEKGWNGFVQALNNNVREKADGTIDGKAGDDWIIDPTAQEHITKKIDDITAYVRMIMPVGTDGAEGDVAATVDAGAGVNGKQEQLAPEGVPTQGEQGSQDEDGEELPGDEDTG
ncbi:hypothetical protein AZH53_02740 [Methanomicrobiaceae archaeon CYW5]|uniref:PKD domain-containing protein n=1 Tax=Methanovulcanius yangii TaxID=1789227 RepID=UPI0029C9E527|nr:PKD domain-containing protein [Methanovulcanius yangii]MBT8507347.1 hypothetical protein [Methanovulcanius yangii]